MNDLLPFLLNVNLLSFEKNPCSGNTPSSRKGKASEKYPVSGDVACAGCFAPTTFIFNLRQKIPAKLFCLASLLHLKGNENFTAYCRQGAEPWLNL
jgi:hypothetical protein